MLVLLQKKSKDHNPKALQQIIQGLALCQCGEDCVWPLYFLLHLLMICPQKHSRMASAVEEGGGGRREGSVAPCVTRFPANQWLSYLIFAIRTLGRPSNPGWADVMPRWVQRGRSVCACVCACMCVQPIYLCVPRPCFRHSLCLCVCFSEIRRWG